MQICSRSCTVHVAAVCKQLHLHRNACLLPMRSHFVLHGNDACHHFDARIIVNCTSDCLQSLTETQWQWQNAYAVPFHYCLHKVCFTLCVIQVFLLLTSSCAAGIFYFLAEAGAVSALPAHLMSDHVFLGSALVSMLSSEAVLLAKDIRCCFCSIKGCVPFMAWPLLVRSFGTARQASQCPVYQG